MDEEPYLPTDSQLEQPNFSFAKLRAGRISSGLLAKPLKRSLFFFSFGDGLGERNDLIGGRKCQVYFNFSHGL